MERTRLQNLLDLVAYFVVRVFVCIAQAMPLTSCVPWAERLATLVARVLKIRHDVIDDNLRHAFPQLSRHERRRLEWEMWRHFFLFLMEVVHAPRKIHETNWRDYINLVNAKEMILAFFDDRPSIVLCGHYGNFELSAFVLGLLGFPTYTVARELDNRYLHQYVDRFRGLQGQHMLSKNGSSQQIEAILERGGILALLGDQYAGRKGCWVEFFGRPASSHKAIALFTLASEAPTMFCFARRRGKPLEHDMGMTALLDPRTMSDEYRSVPALSQWFASELENTVRLGPEQYWWLHRRWKDTRKKRRAAAERAAAERQAAEREAA